MAFVSGKDAYLSVGGTDISTYLNSITVSRSADTSETTTFSAGSKTFVASLKDATISANGYFDASVFSTIAGWLGTQQAFIFGPAGNGNGKVKANGNCIVTQVETGASVGDAVSITLSMQVTGAVTDGTFS